MFSNKHLAKSNLQVLLSKVLEVGNETLLVTLFTILLCFERLREGLQFVNIFYQVLEIDPPGPVL